jgi:GT2 family glycosyltransferase
MLQKILEVLARVFRGLHGKKHDIRLRPLADLSAVDSGAGTWEATGSGPRFALEIPDGQWPCGWVLLESQLLRRTPDYSARLYFDTGNGYAEERALDIPANFKGVIHELVHMPRGLVGVQWAPLHSPGMFEQADFRMTEIGNPGRIFRMVRRIRPVLRRQPRNKLEALGLDVARMFVDLKGAYRAAGKLRTYATAPTYPEWIRRHDTLTDQDRILIRQHIARFSDVVRFELVVAVAVYDPLLLSGTLDSISNQLYRNAGVVLFDAEGQCGARLLEHARSLADAGIEAQCINAAQFETRSSELGEARSGRDPSTFIVTIQAGDVLAEHSLYWMACEAASCPGAGLIYSDEDGLDANGERCAPVFKPGWSLELLRSYNYPGQLVAISADALSRVGGLKAAVRPGDNHDLVLRVCDVLTADRIVHIPAILIHRHGSEADQSTPAAVAAHLARNAINAEVSEIRPGICRTRYRLPPDPPLVSILIPTRDAFHLIKQCVESVLLKSTYPNYELIVIDNRSADADAVAYLASLAARPKVHVLHYEQDFNYSAINNFAARQAAGEVLCLLNNDTEVISPDWLEEMVAQLLQSRVGVVGAKLYYPDGCVQHGGDVVGVGGVANHAHAYLQRSEPGYCNRAVVAQDLSAVTAACMVTWRNLYQELGGLNERDLPVAFNDVDYCLRAREAGYRVVWTPYAELYHHESMTRGKDSTPARKRRAKREVVYMRKRWKKELEHDPFYNPNLSYQRADFSLSHAPMVQKPWLTKGQQQGHESH